jgi:hypothetical protein
MQNDKKQTIYIEQNKKFGRVRVVPRLCGLYPGIFALQLRRKHGKTSVRVAEECQLAQRRYINIQ